MNKETYVDTSSVSFFLLIAVHTKAFDMINGTSSWRLRSKSTKANKFCHSFCSLLIWIIDDRFLLGFRYCLPKILYRQNIHDKIEEATKIEIKSRRSFNEHLFVKGSYVKEALLFCKRRKRNYTLKLITFSVHMKIKSQSFIWIEYQPWN
jgi:hypothetical protein